MTGNAGRAFNRERRKRVAVPTKNSNAGKTLEFYEAAP
jgi:hypothetical protein